MLKTYFGYQMLAYKSIKIRILQPKLFPLKHFEFSFIFKNKPLI